ncbi:MAG: N-acetylmuramoyl-L-alanine amidase family protein [Armatimonadota bacterium]|nr:N-acetylmuramoyl-L-alanine amidase family protein [Armatimonadota bacterium]
MKLSGALLLTVVLLASPSRSASGQSSALRLVVNGQAVPLAASPIAYNGQVVVPLPGIFEPFGAAAAWLPEERAILISNRTRTTIRLRLNDPYALVNGQQRLLPVPALLLRDLPYIPALAVFGLLGAWTHLDEREGVLYANSVVTGVTVQRTGGTVRLVVGATGPVQVETRTLTNPDRVALDLRHAVFRQTDQEVPVGEGGILRARISQFQTKPYVTRIVLDLAQPVEVRLAESPTAFDLTVEVRPRPATGRPAQAVPPPATSPAAPPAPSASPASPPGAPRSSPAAAPSGSPPAAGSPAAPPDAAGPPGGATPGTTGIRILQVRVEAGPVTRVVVEGTGPMQPVVRELPDPDRLVVDIPDSVFVPVKQEIPVGTPAIENVRAAQFQADPDITRVVVTLRRKVPYTIAAEGTTLVITLTDGPVRGHVVVVDPGHGGRDPGAIGPTGLVEKEVNLDIALRLRRLLVGDGIRVVMTRETDATVELPDRVRIARERGGTVFVSIHANAHARGGPIQSGTETYFLNAHSQALAQLVQDELVRALGLPNRGVKTANFYVLRESTMPAILVEVAFISHPAEEARLREDAFRERVAEAIARGVARFLVVFPVPAGH